MGGALGGRTSLVLRPCCRPQFWSLRNSLALTKAGKNTGYSSIATAARLNRRVITFLLQTLTMIIFILQRCLQLLVLPFFVLYYLGLWDPFIKKIFPYIMSKISKSYNRILHKEKERLFHNMQDFADSTGKLSLVEIGVGTGTNFQFYPPGCQVTCIDYNPNFKKFLLKSMAQNTHLQFENFMVASAEDLRPIPDDSVDVVVCTLLLCSVPNINGILKEVLRILRPGGVFYFMEHVAGDQSSWIYFWQQVCDPSWQYFTDGCSITRETWKYLENAKFSEINLQHIMPPLHVLVRPHICGYAVK